MSKWIGLVSSRSSLEINYSRFVLAAFGSTYMKPKADYPNPEARTAFLISIDCEFFGNKIVALLS